MNQRTLHHATLIALMAAASVAVAQTSSSGGSASGSMSGSSANATHGAGSAPANTGSGMGRGAPGVSGASSMSHGHAGKHAKGTTAAAHTDSAYDAALRRCVQGASAERDRCVDQAISQYSR